MAAEWKLKAVQSTSERIDWLLEPLSLAITIAVLMSVSSEQAMMATLVPIFGAFCVGISLGLFKKIAQAEGNRPAPRFVTSFIFYVSFALVILTPYLKYPSLGSQIRELESSADKPDYYASGERTLPLAFVFFLGVLATITAFAVCNAL